MCNDCGIATCPQDTYGPRQQPMDSLTETEVMDLDYFTEVDIVCGFFTVLTGYPITICHRPECNYWVRVTGWGYNAGFAGEGLSWETYSCGHSRVDEGRYHDD